MKTFVRSVGDSDDALRHFLLESVAYRWLWRGVVFTHLRRVFPSDVCCPFFSMFYFV